MQTNGGSVSADSVTEYHDPAGVASWRIIGNTLECWGEGGPSSSVGLVTFPFPKTFKRRPVLNITGVRDTFNQSSIGFLDHTDGLDAQPGFTAWTADTASFKIAIATNGSGIADRYVWHAIGEWDGVS